MFDGGGSEDFPPPSNRGGNFQEAQTNVSVDWVSVSLPAARCFTEGGIGGFLKEVRRLFDETVQEFRQRNGLHGYSYSVVSDNGGVVVAWGGNNETIFLQIPGDGCSRVRCFASLADFCDVRGGHLTRVDIAFDDFSGVLDLEHAVSLYRGGGFAARGGGARSGASAVSCSQAGNWLEPDGKGRTLNVGRLVNGKMLCVYEKGKQLGDSTSRWVRWEVRLANRDRALPLECLTAPASFARGAYPALDFIDGPECRIATRRIKERISLAKLSQHASDAYGKLLNVLRRDGQSAEQVVKRLRRDGVPKRLTAPSEVEIQDKFNRLMAEIRAENEDVETWK